MYKLVYDIEDAWYDDGHGDIVEITMNPETYQAFINEVAIDGDVVDVPIIYLDLGRAEISVSPDQEEPFLIETKLHPHTDTV